ncbi:MAG: arylsulfotransferase family protein [Acidimicrobiales bacterium]
MTEPALPRPGGGPAVSRRQVLRGLLGVAGLAVGATAAGVTASGCTPSGPGRAASTTTSTGSAPSPAPSAPPTAPVTLGRGPVLAAQRSTAPGSVPRFKSRPDLRPPPIVVDVHHAGADPGLVMTDCHGGKGQQGPMIIGPGGELVWFDPVSDHGTPTLRAFNLRVQAYRGRPVLCWFEGAVVDGHGQGHYRIVDQSYRPVATVHGANGLHGDLHELFLTDRGTAVFTAYGTATADLSRLGGAKDGSYFYGEVQEVDVATGQLLFSWRSDHHVGFGESYSTPPADGQVPWDYFHINSIAEDPSDHSLVVSSRNCWAAYKIGWRGGGAGAGDRGKVLWRLGGKRSDFAVDANARWAYQHDVTPQAGGTYTIFDNEGSPWVDPPSRALVLSVDEAGRRARLSRQYLHSPAVRSPALGSVQDLAGGHVFVGWGDAAYFTEYGASGQVLDDTQLVGVISYRAFKQAWIGRPTRPPDLAVDGSGSSGPVLYVSWNGATEVASWRVLAGPSPSRLSVVGTARKLGWETRVVPGSALHLAGGSGHVAVEALDASGGVLSTSAVQAL